MPLQGAVVMASEQERRQRLLERKHERFREQQLKHLFEVPETADAPTVSWVELCGKK